MTKFEIEVKKRGPIYQFAGKSRINLPRMIGIAKGKIKPNEREIKRIAEELNVEPEEVLELVKEEI